MYVIITQPTVVKPSSSCKPSGHHFHTKYDINGKRKQGPTGTTSVVKAIAVKLSRKNTYY